MVLIILERPWQSGEAPEAWKTGNVHPVFKKDKTEHLGNYRPVSFISLPGKVMEHVLLEAISKDVGDKVAGRSQHGFAKGEIVPYQSAGLLRCNSVDRGRTVHVAYIDFSKVCSGLPCNMQVQFLEFPDLFPKIKQVCFWIPLLRSTRNQFRSVAARGLLHFKNQLYLVYNSVSENLVMPVDFSSRANGIRTCLGFTLFKILHWVVATKHD